MRKLISKFTFLLCIAILSFSLVACSGEDPETTCEKIDYYPEIVEVEAVPINEDDNNQDDVSDDTSETDSPELTQEPEQYEELSTEPDPLAQPEPEPEQVPATSATGASAVSDDIFAFSAKLNGIVYELPFPVSDLIADGWVLETRRGAPETIDPNRHISKHLTSRHYSIFVYVLNRTYNVIPIEEGEVIGVALYSFGTPTGANFMISGNLEIGTHYDNIIAAHGEPTHRGTGTTLTRLYYAIGTWDHVRITIDNQTQQVVDLRVQNFTAREASTPITLAVENLPEVVAAYVPPTGFGDSWRDFVVRYGGALYQLPAPVAEFVANGWIIESDPEQMIPARSMQPGIELRLGNQTLRAVVRNYDEVARPIKHGHVTTVQFFRGRVNIPIELIGGVTENSAIEDVIEALGEPTGISEGPNFNVYSYIRGISGRIEIGVENATGAITRIDVRNEPTRLG